MNNCYDFFAVVVKMLSVCLLFADFLCIRFIIIVFVYLMHSCVPTLKTANTALQSYTLKIVSCYWKIIVFNDLNIEISLYFCYNISMKV